MRVVRRVPANGSGTCVSDLMAKSIVTGDPRQTLVEAAAQMRVRRTSALAVLDDQALVGIITERDLMRAVADGLDPSATHVSQYMTHSPQTVDASESATEAAVKMIKHRIRHLPVTTDGRLVGFLSARDLLALRPWPSDLPIGESW